MAVTQVKNGFAGGSDDQLLVNPDGSINVNTSGGGSSSVNIHDSSGNVLTSTGGALNVNTTGSSVVSGTVSTNENALKEFATSQYSIGVVAVQITPTPLTDRKSISIRAVCTGGNAIYIGPTSAVTTSTGWLLYSGDILSMDLDTSHTIYAIANAAGQTIFALEISS